ncbi:HWE histidine kinase domain-containing protein [Brevundimonas sp.]|uniref:HWE histidine kinase domain-containing protein n=1 Tax=Brevundimonas sp. TaxID=1871086 RepID=UPI0017E42593|nr:HWE histidine kinase domain-containing protein [Brevundimonas sp.]MBA3050669.1 PAS domain-containing protein [Brevundimonas sp.]
MTSTETDLAAALEASPNAYFIVDRDLKFVWANAAYLAMTQRSADDLIGTPVFEAFDAGPGAEAPENARQLRASFEKAFATGLRNDIPVIHYAIPLPRADGLRAYEDRYWSVVHTPLLRDGVVEHVLQYAIDITELERLRRSAARELETSAASTIDAIVGGTLLSGARTVQADNARLETERQGLMDLFMQAPGFVAVLSGPDHVFQIHNGAYAQLIGHRDIAGKPTREALPEVRGQGYFEFLDTVYATGEPYEGRASRVQLQRTPDAPLESRFLDFIYQPIRDARGGVVGIFVQGHDVTETVRSTERQKLMIDELNHRVKNTLATVQSIAMQTARSHPDPGTFAEGFQARLLALSHTHDLLTRSHWEGADLPDVLSHETIAHGPHRITPIGPPVALGSAAALSFGMIFHELATNAAKYGALSGPEGRVLVDWAIANQTRPVLTLTWRETDGPPVSPPSRKGFGSRLIERNVRHDLAGEVKLDYADDGFIAEFSVPLDFGRS